MSDKYELPVDEERYIIVNHTLECYYILLSNPNAKLKSYHKDIQNRINAYEKTQNMVMFMTPTMREFKEEEKQ